jgi:hypothetical protein
MNRNSTTRTVSRWLTVALIGTFIPGCGDSGIPRQAVYGRIDGAEGRSGLVSFVPRENTQGPAARASLVNGEYQFSRTDGPVPGDYTVIIQLEVSPDMTSGVAVFKGIEIPELRFRRSTKRWHRCRFRFRTELRKLSKSTFNCRTHNSLS